MQIGLDTRQVYNQKERGRPMGGGFGEQKVCRNHLVRINSRKQGRETGWKQINQHLRNQATVLLHNPVARGTHTKLQRRGTA